MEKIKVFVVDDNIAARAMLMNMIKTQSDMEIVGEGGSAKASVMLIAEARPDVVMLEMETGEIFELNEFMAQVRNISPDIRVIICAAKGDDELVTPVTESGAKDFIRKPYNRLNLFRTIRHAMDE